MTRRNLTYRVDLPGGQDRLREMILYVCNQCENAPRFGKVKLNKILWRADFESFAERGVPVTGRAYQRLKAGPAPVEMPILLREMEGGELLTFTVTDFGDEVKEERPTAKVKASLRWFSEDDLRFVNAAIEYFWDKTATKTSDLSHGMAWKSRDNLDPMPYESAYLVDQPLPKATLNKIAKRGAEAGWKSQ